MFISGDMAFSALLADDCFLFNKELNFELLRKAIEEFKITFKQNDEKLKRFVVELSLLSENYYFKYFFITNSGIVVLCVDPVDCGIKNFCFVTTDRDAFYLQLIITRMVELEKLQMEQGLSELKELNKSNPYYELIRNQDLLAQYSRPIEEFDFSVRTANCLRLAGILYLGDLVLTSDDDLLAIKHFGLHSLRDVKMVIDKIGVPKMTMKLEKEFQKAVGRK